MVEVVEYQADWPVRFELLRDAYAAALDAAEVPVHSIEHVGSTSVPGLAAKPIIDVDVIVVARDVDAASDALVSIGFARRGDLGVADRYAFVTPDRFAPSNTYVVVDGSLALRNHLTVRDVLRADATLRAEYDAVKRQAARSAPDIDAYIAFKSDVLGRILERGGVSAEERAAIAEANGSFVGRGAQG